jgi:hypothetical protein
MQLVLGVGRRSIMSATIENMVLAFEITSNVITTSGLRAAILDSIKMQLEFGVGRRSVVLVNLDNMVLAFEIVFLRIL